MSYEPPDSGELDELRELNLLFLSYLQSSAREASDCLGLAPGIAARLAEAPGAVIERAAAFPRALFALNLGKLEATRKRFVAPRTMLDQTRQALCLTILNSAWHMSRRRDFQARMFLRLEPSVIHRLRVLPLSELPLLATIPGILTSALPNSPGLWTTLLDRAHSEIPRALRLVALHPDVDGRQDAQRLLGSVGATP